MGDKSRIEWTDATWNPTTGCDQISPGCDNCYAKRDAKRLKAMGVKAYQNDGDPPRSGPGFGFTLHADRLDQPRRWTKPRRIFVNSMSDLFHEQMSLAFLEQVFDVMHDCPRHTFQVLTKRHRGMHRLLNGGWPYSPCSGPIADHRAEPSPNVWLGVSVEDQQWADTRIPWLLKTPAAVRWLSMEPLLGPVDIRQYLPDPIYNDGSWYEDANGVARWDLGGAPCDPIDWVVVGGESGPGHRPINPQWARDIRDQCVAAGVPFHFKQWSGHRPKSLGRELDGRTWDQYPQ